MKLIHYLPVGKHLLRGTRNGKLLKIWVQINRATFNRISSNFQARGDVKKRWWIAMNAKEEECAMWVKRFVWRESGVWVEVEIPKSNRVYKNMVIAASFKTDIDFNHPRGGVIINSQDRPANILMAHPGCIGFVDSQKLCGFKAMEPIA